MKIFGGFWTEEKLDAFSKYVNAYLTILNKNKKKYNWTTVYFDGFSGSGDIKDNKDFLEETFFSDDDKNDLINYKKGSVRRILEIPREKNFDKLFFIDRDPENIKSINTIVKDLNLDPESVRTSIDDCNDNLRKFSDYIRKKDKRSLILLDPFGMQLDWSSIESLKNTKSDIWILVPSGVAINRLLSKKIELTNFDKLSKFFGLSKDELRNYFYSESTQTKIFDDVIDFEKVSNPIDKIIKLYIKQLKEIWKHTLDEPLLLTNSKNATLFHFIFASNNETGYKIASDIVGKKKR